MPETPAIEMATYPCCKHCEDDARYGQHDDTHYAPCDHGCDDEADDDA